MNRRVHWVVSLCLAGALALTGGAGTLHAGTVYVDDSNTSGVEDGTAGHPYNTVQEGINAAAGGDTVEVAEGTYVENIDFNGKAITVRSADPDDPTVVAATILDGNQAGSVVTFQNGEGPDSVLRGLTIRGGQNWAGGGIYCWAASPTITQNTITDNSAEWGGGGIFCVDPSSPLIENNIIRDNVAENEYGWGTGGGIYCTSWFGESSTPTIRDNIIENNVASYSGGGIGCEGNLQVGAWESEGWTVVYQGNVSVTSTGWVVFEFQTPFDYNGTDNLLVDFSYNNDWSLWGEPGWCLASAPGGLRTIWYPGWGDDPLTWSGNLPAPLPSDLVPDVRLGGDSAVTIGTGTGQSEFPLYTWSSSARTQVIYLASEIGGANRISSLALNVAQVPGAPLTRWTIRMKHTSLNACPVSFDLAPTITGNLIKGNVAEGGATGGMAWGGGIYCQLTEAIIEHNRIGENTAGRTQGSGGGIYSNNGASAISNNVIWSNRAGGDTDEGFGRGGGICLDSELEPQPMRNNTVIGNSAGRGGGGGISCTSPHEVSNSILWGNGVDLDGCVATYSCIEDGDPGTGNFSYDPMFADPAADDYHLKSQAGRWDPAANSGAGGWILDSVTSPCIDAGDPASDYGNEPSPNGGRINMGAYGNTAFASKSVPDPVLASVLPDSGPPYTLMKITGSWFGFAEGTVEVAGTPLNILVWSDTEIRCEVPPEATSGPLVVKRLNGVESDPVAFAVTDPTILYVDDDNTSGIENGTLTWPFSTVQRAIRAGTNGDTVQVAAGTYCENINFLGKAITVRSTDPDDPAVVAATILDGNQAGSTVTFNHGEGVSSVLKGFTIRGGSGGIATGYCGGGICCQGASPTIEKNIITGNTALAHGGGIFCYGGAATIQDNRVEANEARWFGGGIACWNSTATVTGNLIWDNTAHWYGGGLFAHGPAAPTVKNNVLTGNTGSEGAGLACLYQCAPLLENNTLAANTAERAGGGLYAGWNCSPIVRNTILWANAAPNGPGLALDVNSTANVSYSNVQGGQALVYAGTGCSLTWGTGNINLDPLLDASGYCHLKSTGGRYDRASGLPPESAGAWVLDGVTSPCIDTGDPLSAYAVELLPNGDRINMGAWGNTAYASKPAAVGGLALGGTSAPADGAAAVVTEGEPADETVGQGGDEGEDQGTGGEDKGTGGDEETAVRSLVLDGPAPRLESTDPVLGGNLAGRTTLTLTFDRPVTVGAGAAEVYGETTGAHADYSITYGNGKRTVRIEWASPLPADAYEVRLVAEFVLDDKTGLPLDGEVSDPADPESLPSGDGKPGGNAELEFEAE
ncbi:MAG TPA: right-handed parallel beta-helix repeat-containing protein [Phycisphaerae bacterium]|nr:right-handed parallel beta-helix repeat-containing protein [Phycisphaerae bacterium]